MLMTLNVLSIFRINFDFTEALFYKIKINSHGFHATKKEKKEGIFHTFLRRGDVLLLNLKSTVVNNIILIH